MPGSVLERIRALAASQGYESLLSALDSVDASSMASVGIGEATLVLEAASHELDALRKLLTLVDEKQRALQRIDPANVVASHRAFDAAPRMDTANTLRMLHELRTRAYGKLVLLRPLTGGPTTAFRIAQANYGFPVLGVINRLAPVAQQVVSAEVGDQLTLPKGEFEVIAVAHLDRHAGNELTENAGNFKRMDLIHAELSDRTALEDVAHALQVGVEELVQSIISTGGREVWLVPRHTPVAREVQREDTERLGAHFYTRTTKLQERLMQRSDEGLAVVLGVAGSGKTSVALGRTKVLCDRIPEEGDDRFFTPETSVGFVLSSQLCGYLKRTCEHLALFDMPVHEYHALRSRLIQLRRLNDAGFERDVHATVNGPEGSMAWLHAADASIAPHVAAGLRSALAKVPAEREREGPGRTGRKRSPDQTASLATLWSVLQREIDGVAKTLEAAAGTGAFRLQGLASALDDSRARFASRLEESSDWRGPANRDLRQNVRNAIRERIIRALRLPEAYAAALSSGSLAQELGLAGGDHPEDASAVAAAAARTASRRLSDLDLDVLLALAHVVSLGYRGRQDRDPISHLTEPDWYTQVFVDKFQDFSEVQLFVMASQAHPDRRTVTIVGDPAQKLGSARRVDLRSTFPWAPGEEVIPGVLLENKRQEPALARFSQRFREDVLRDVPDVAIAFPDGGASPRFLDVTGSALASAVYDEVVRVPRDHSVAVVCPDESVARDLERELREPLGSDFRETRLSARADLLARFYVHFTTPLEAKGLEFDTTVVPAIERFDLGEAAQANACYVAISRPRRALSLLGEAKHLHEKWKTVLTSGLVCQVSVNASGPEEVA